MPLLTIIVTTNIVLVDVLPGYKATVTCADSVVPDYKIRHGDAQIPLLPGATKLLTAVLKLLFEAHATVTCTLGLHSYA